MSNRICIKQRVMQAAEKTLNYQNYVSPIDVLVGIGILKPAHIQDWRKGKVPYLERIIEGNLSKISYAMKCFRSWAIQKGLKPSKTAYLLKTKDAKKELRFSKSGNPQIEMAYRTHYISAVLSQKKQQRTKGKLEQPQKFVQADIQKEWEYYANQNTLG